MKVGDYWLIGLLLACSAIGWWFAAAPASATAKILILIAGAPERTREITAPFASATISIAGKAGISQIQIAPDGRARFLSSACPNRVCIRSGWIAPPMAVPCIPNGVMVQAISAQTTMDGVTY